MSTEFRIMRLPIAAIRLDDQLGRNLHLEKVQMYAAMLKEGEPFPPVTVCFDGEVYWLKDGFHRLAVAKAAGADEIEAQVTLGVRTEMTVGRQKTLLGDSA